MEHRDELRHTGPGQILRVPRDALASVFLFLQARSRRSLAWVRRALGKGEASRVYRMKTTAVKRAKFRIECPNFARGVWRALGQDRRFVEENLILAPGERIIISTRYHWLWMLRDYRSWTKISRLAVTVPVAWIADQVTGLVLSGGLWWMTAISWSLFIVHGGMFLYKFLAWRAGLFIVTTAKPIWVHGVFHRTAKPISVPGNADIQITQTLTGRILGYGELRIEHTLFSIDSKIHHIFEYLPNPRKVHRVLVAQQSCDLSGIRRAKTRDPSRPSPPAGRRHPPLSEAAYE